MASNPNSSASTSAVRSPARTVGVRSSLARTVGVRSSPARTLGIGSPAIFSSRIPDRVSRLQVLPLNHEQPALLGNQGQDQVPPVPPVPQERRKFSSLFTEEDALKTEKLFPPPPHGHGSPVPKHHVSVVKKEKYHPPWYDPDPIPWAKWIKMRPITKILADEDAAYKDVEDEIREKATTRKRHSRN